MKGKKTMRQKRWERKIMRQKGNEKNETKT